MKDPIEAESENPVKAERKAPIESEEKNLLGSEGKNQSESEGNQSGFEGKNQSESEGKKPLEGKDSLEVELRKQMEFYFGDSNLGKDRFIRQRIQETSDGFLPLSMFLGFNRIKDLCSSLGPLKSCLAKSEFLELAELRPEEGPLDAPLATFVRRKLPIPADLDFDQQTVYIENFDRDMEHDALKQLLSPLFGEISYISIPRNERDRTPKGFCFVEFMGKEQADHFLSFVDKLHSGTSLDPDAALLLEKLTPANRKHLKKIRAISKTEWLRLRKEYKDHLYHQQQLVHKWNLKRAIEGFLPNVLLELTNISEKSTSGSLEKFLSPIAPVYYVDYQRGETKATVRFKSSEGAQAALAHFDKEPLLHSNADDFIRTSLTDDELLKLKAAQPLSARLIKDDEELDYWRKIQVGKQKREEAKKKKEQVHPVRKLVPAEPPKPKMPAKSFPPASVTVSTSMFEVPKRKQKKKSGKPGANHVRFDDSEEGSEEEDEEDEGEASSSAQTGKGGKAKEGKRKLAEAGDTDGKKRQRLEED